jgi:choline kinase
MEREIVKPRQTVILAAGFGQRIGSQEHGVPKPLMEVAGRPLIEYALAQAAAAGCEEAVVVTGSSGGLLNERLKGKGQPLAVKIVPHADYHLPNGISLLAAEPHVGSAFFLQMADHLFGEPVLAPLAASDAAPSGRLRLLVDRRPVYLDEEDATKVCLDGDRISAIGKELSRWDAIDTGCFLLDGRVFDALRQVECREETSVSAGMERLIAAGLLSAVELTGVTWVDVDTPLDRRRAGELFGERGPFGV